MEFIIATFVFIIFFAVLILIGIILLIRARVLRKEYMPGILFSIFGGTPLLIAYLAFCSLLDSTIERAFTIETGIDLPASAKIINKKHSIQMRTDDYDEAFIAEMNSEDYANLLNTFEKDSIFLKEDPFICSAGRVLMKKAKIDEKDMIWFIIVRSDTHGKIAGFHPQKQLFIYARYMY